MQERAVQAAVDGESLLSIFPTGGGKSLTFQLPAIMAGRNEHGLTMVISPLQSLMKDQVDNLADKGITEAVTINGLLDPISRTRKTRELAEKLTSDGFPALPFNGKMEANDKIANQNAFMDNQVRAIVATSAFGMGVDKKDVGMVIHYDISDSLENYVQEAGRAGRDPQLNAQCYILYSDHDLDKHFILLNQTKLSISEIQQVWKAVKDITRQRKTVSCSALEIARQAGWNDEVMGIETRVRTALAALEEAGYISRGNNVPRVFATGIMVKNMEEARKHIEHSSLFSNDVQTQAIRIIKSLISNKYKAGAGNGEAESRVDYLADMLGMTKAEVIQAVSLMRQEGILADSRDMTAFLHKTDNEKKSLKRFESFAKLEQFLLAMVISCDNEIELSYKELNESALSAGIHDATIRNFRTILYFLSIKSYIKKKENIEKLYTLPIKESENANQDLRLVQFSVTELQKQFTDNPLMNTSGKHAQSAMWKRLCFISAK